MKVNVHIQNYGNILTSLKVSTALVVFSALIWEVTATVGGVPTLNGPIPVVNNVQFGQKRVGDFVHPGLWHTHDDLEYMRNNVLSGKDPWKTAYAAFSNDSYSLSTVSLRTGFFSRKRNADSVSIRCKDQNPFFAGGRVVTTQLSRMMFEQHIKMQSCVSLALQFSFYVT
jgi:hypothetical protein